MTDDWSLKEKKLGYSYQISDMGERGYDWVSPELKKEWEACWYKEDDIDILRLKLIEDVKERVKLIRDDAFTSNVIIEKDYDAFITERLIEIINKRFGRSDGNPNIDP